MNEIIKITGEIKPEIGESICEDFLIAEKNPEVDKIIFLISSGGGNVSVIPTIWELIKMSKKDVYAIGTSCVASTASAIFMMAPRRILMPNTEFILHKSSRILNGAFTSDALEDILRESKEKTELLFASVLQNSKLPRNVLYRKTKGYDWILGDKEIEKYGIITESYNIEEVHKLLVEE